MRITGKVILPTAAECGYSSIKAKWVQPAIIVFMFRLNLLFCLIMAACSLPVYQSAPESGAPASSPTERIQQLSPVSVETEEIPDTLTPASVKTDGLPETLTPTIEPTSTTVRAPEPEAPFEVKIHPDGPLYVGDWVSLEVIDNSGDALAGRSIDVSSGAVGTLLVEGEGFSPFGVGGRTQATLMWVWDTTGLEAGAHQLLLSIEPDGHEWTETVTLNSREELPPGERDAHWQLAESDCCVVHYISGTAAERDVDELLRAVDKQVAQVSQQLEYELEKPLSFTFFPRVLGHGGFAQEDISVAYLDRNYAGSNPEIVLRHEIVHALDARIGAGLRPTILSEGLAVYLSGGHFKPEQLLARAAALLEAQPGCEQVDVTANDLGQEACALDWYLPLDQLLDDFYFEQHEIGYLQAGALVEFIVETWGWEAFSSFYRDIHPVEEAPHESRLEGGSHALAIDTALREHFDISIGELERMYIDAMQAVWLTSEHVLDVRSSVEYYETVRRYQNLLDPSAFFLTAWLPDNAQMRERGIVADYLRHPVEAENLALEVMLVEADEYLLADDYQPAQEILSGVNAVLAALENDEPEPFTANNLAQDYLQVVQSLVDAGYNPYKVSISENQARAFVTRYESEPSNMDRVQSLVMVRTHAGWSFISEAGN